MNFFMKKSVFYQKKFVYLPKLTNTTKESYDCINLSNSNFTAHRIDDGF